MISSTFLPYSSMVSFRGLEAIVYDEQNAKGLIEAKETVWESVGIGRDTEWGVRPWGRGRVTVSRRC